MIQHHDVTQEEVTSCPSCGNVDGVAWYQYMTIEKRLKKKWWVFKYYKNVYVTYKFCTCIYCGAEWKEKQGEVDCL